MDFFKTVEKNTKLVVYTDGACAGNPGPGGWGVLIKTDMGDSHEFNGGEAQTTNNRMELTACIEALKIIPPEFSLTIRTDSRYVQDGIQKWIKGWKKNGWMTASKAPVKNKDLWQALDAFSQNRPVGWEWVAGHSGEPGNERADTLARQGIVSAVMRG